MHLSEKKLSGEQIFSGRVIDLSVDKVELENGKITTRELITHPGGVCVVPIDENGDIYMVNLLR